MRILNIEGGSANWTKLAKSLCRVLLASLIAIPVLTNDASADKAKVAQIGRAHV